MSLVARERRPFTTGDEAQPAPKPGKRSNAITEMAQLITAGRGNREGYPPARQFTVTVRGQSYQVEFEQWAGHGFRIYSDSEAALSHVAEQLRSHIRGLATAPTHYYAGCKPCVPLWLH